MNYRDLSRADTVVGVVCKTLYSPFGGRKGPRIRGVHPVASQPIRRPTRNPDHTRSSFNTQDYGSYPALETTRTELGDARG